VDIGPSTTFRSSIDEFHDSESSGPGGGGLGFAIGDIFARSFEYTVHDSGARNVVRGQIPINYPTTLDAIPTICSRRPLLGPLDFNFQFSIADTLRMFSAVATVLLARHLPS
jgi:hypothetical protein